MNVFSSARYYGELLIKRNHGGNARINKYRKKEEKYSQSGDFKGYPSENWGDANHSPVGGW